MTVFAAAKAISEGLEPSQFAPGLAGGVLAGLIGWGWLRAVRRRYGDHFFAALYFAPVLNSAHRGFLEAFFVGLGAALAVSLFLLASTPLMAGLFRPSSSDHPSRDADMGGAAGAGGVEGGGAGS